MRTGAETPLPEEIHEDRLLAWKPKGEIKQLRRENEYLRRQREILKKAASILSEDPQLGMR